MGGSVGADDRRDGREQVRSRIALCTHGRTHAQEEERVWLVVRAYDVLPSHMFLDESDCIPPDALTDKRMVSTEARAISQRPDQRQQHQPTPTPPQPAHTEEEGVHCCICLRSCLTLGAFALLILLTFLLRASVRPTVFKLLGRCR